LRRVYRSLRDDVHKITVDPELAARGRKPVERMLSIV
jgi:quinolinate synthase